MPAVDGLHLRSLERIARHRLHPHIAGMPEPSTIAAILWAVILGGAGGLLTTIGPWYRELKKPGWQPPDWLFGPAWTVILGLAAWASVLALCVGLRDYSVLASWLIVPYLAWVSFAAVLNWQIVRLNGPFGARA